jgi:hypothetical protein
MKSKSTVRLKSQRGIAMMVALLALVLLAAIGIGFMFMADTENSINNNYRDAQKAYFAARAGAENVRVLLAPAGTLNGSAAGLTMPQPNAKTGVIYVLNPTSGEAVDPTGASAGADLSIKSNPYLDDELCQEQFTNFNATLTPTTGPCAGAGHVMLSNTYFTMPAVTTADIPGTGGADALSFKWVRITNKQDLMGTMSGTQSVSGNALTPGQQVCYNGVKEVVTAPGNCGNLTPVANPVWLLTSLAVTPKVGNNPGSRKMVQMEVALTPPLITPAPISTQAPVTLQGSYIVDGTDFCSCKCTTTTSGTGSNQTTSTSCTTTNGAAACYNTAHAVYTAGTVSQLGSSGTSIVDTSVNSSPYVQKVNPWPYNIDDLINQYKAGATKPSWSSSCTGTPNFFSIPPSYLSCGTFSQQQFGTYPKSLTQTPPVEPSPGSIDSVTEYIPGSVHLTSGASGSGILIVDGDLAIDGGLNWYGLILVRGQVTFTGGAGGSTTGNVNLYGSILAGEDVTAANQNVVTVDGDKFGGSTNFHFDVCALKNLNNKRPPRLLATHELMF